MKHNKSDGIILFGLVIFIFYRPLSSISGIFLEPTFLKGKIFSTREVPKYKNTKILIK